VDKAREFLINHRRSDPARLRFEQCNLYDLRERLAFETKLSALKSWNIYSGRRGW